MKKLILATVVGVSMAAGMAAVVTAPPAYSQTEVRAIPQQAPKPVQTNVAQPIIREQRSIGDAIRSMRIPTAHKNRSGGERANRRWRKSRASGRR